MPANISKVEFWFGSSFHRNLLIRPEGHWSGKTVLVFPDWLGRTPAQEEFALNLAAEGHVAMCMDVYGGGRTAADAAEAEALMTPLVQDRNGLMQLLQKLVGQVRKALPQETGQLSTIGFCFGGLCVLDLARAGEELDFVASFHGVLEPPASRTNATIKSKIAIFHGWRDPIASQASLMNLAEELNRADVRWELHCCGNAQHAFMMPHAAAPEAGILYNEAAAQRSWQILLAMLGGQREIANDCDPLPAAANLS